MSSPICPSAHISTPFIPGASAKAAQHAKNDKYKGQCLANSHDFTPFAVDCFGVFAYEAIDLLKRLINGLVTFRGMFHYLAFERYRSNDFFVISFWIFTIVV